ncbi:MAG: cytochrome c oxidase subunit II [bacterium JZ-2024 1]
MTIPLSILGVNLLGLPENVSAEGQWVDQLYTMIFALVVVMFILTEGALIYFILRYRATRNPTPYYTHGSKTAEVIWTVVPALILILVAFSQISAWRKLKIEPPPPEASFRVEIFAQQFLWNIRYPGPDGAFATSDDIVTFNDLRVPVDTPVLLQLRARDVIHSFYLPALRIKQDVVPGYTTQVWFRATRTGDFEIACAELCGSNHYAMRGFLKILSAEEINGWLSQKYNEMIENQTTPPDWGWPWENIKQCSTQIPIQEPQGSPEFPFEPQEVASP